jgi:AcrR family transcriptional regulator
MTEEAKSTEAKSTKDRILDAAETLLGERGPGETSLRDITSAAGVNLAAVNYHFQSKEALLRAVVDRRIIPIQQRRLELLDAAEAEAVEGAPDLARVIEAFLLPPLEMIVRAPQFVPLMGRIYTEPQFVEEIIQKHMLPYKTRILAALRRACPGLSDEALVWRIHFSLGAMTHVLAGAHLIRLSSDGQCDPSNLDTIRRQIVAFVVAGCRAPEPKDT